MADDLADEAADGAAVGTARLAPDYDYDVYVSYFQGSTRTHVGAGPRVALDWVRAAIDDLRRTFAVIRPSTPPPRVYHQLRDDEIVGRLSDTDKAALASSAVLLVIVTPEYCSSARAQEELALFIAKLKAQGGANRQLLCCDLIPIDDTLAAKLPWRNGTLTGIDNLLGPPLYDTIAQLPIGDGQTRTELLKQIAGDVDSRLGKLERIFRAVDAVQRPLPAADPAGEASTDADSDADAAVPEQVYMLDCKDEQRWNDSHRELSRKLFVNPLSRKADPADVFSMAKQQDRRRNFLLNCAGLVILRSAHDEDLDFLVSTSTADRSDMQRMKRKLQCVLVDWEGAPPPDLPKFFKFDLVDPRDSGWVDKVVRIMKRNAPATAP